MIFGAKIWRISYSIEQVIRILSMQFILAPAAYGLPRKWAMFIADALALLLVILPRPGLDTYRQMRSAFGKGRVDSFYLAWGWLARPFRDFVVLKRLLYKRENPFNWRIVERNVDGINSLRESGESYIIANAHFTKEPIFSLYSPGVTYGHPVQVADTPRKRIRGLYDLRIHIQYGTLLKAILSCWGRDPEIIFSGSDLRTARALYKKLCKRGNVVYIAVDAPWPKNLTGSTYERPFAGYKSRVFPTGAAQLARMTQCPIISCVCSLESDGTIVLEWGSPIRCVGNRAENDLKVMDELLNVLEVGVGERPTQYIFEIGKGRRWNSRNRRWENLTE